MNAPPDGHMTLVEHLVELRSRLMKAVGAVAIGMLVCWIFYNPILDALLTPYCETLPDATVEDSSFVTDENCRLIQIDPLEGFSTRINVAAYGGIALAMPVILWQVWRFVAPGLHAHERVYVVPFVLFGTLFFLAGAAFCWRFVFQVGYGFFIDQYASIGIEPAIRVSEYLSFSSRLLLAFGLTFDLPVLAFFLARTGAIDHMSLLRPWRYAIIGIAVVAAVLTPGPDVASQMLLAAPLTLLYGVSIGVAWAFRRREPEE